MVMAASSGRTPCMTLAATELGGTEMSTVLGDGALRGWGRETSTRSRRERELGEAAMAQEDM
ncbi:hypothetical protein E2562_036525 [Oryza meyeriana var. granulata]|uniref:Uncharacterized protein n=1 Tax=Oryza meyeriana var. granulata TaxID=110450 RepID=A0A6G1FG75_9ORYZ|nr:hypothetical protein E2562_036525 [Oryza meyeriana var. granulata]